jgi:DnaJ-class molecular chaperone
MKKYLLITVAAIACTIGVNQAASALRDVEDHSKCENGFKCAHCDGTGFKKGANVQCFMCKGTGKNSSY